MLGKSTADIIKKLEAYSPVAELSAEKPLPTLSHIQIKSGGICNSKMQTLINTVNCVGVMGKGIALGFKNKYPDMFKDYQKRCASKSMRLGGPYLYEVSGDRKIINFPTKGHWKEDSKLENIEKGLLYLSNHLKEWGVKSLAVPPLGCTNGNLNWEDVFPLIKKYLYPLNIPLEIYTPSQPAPQKKPTTLKMKENNITAFFGHRSEESKETKPPKALYLPTSVATGASSSAVSSLPMLAGSETNTPSPAFSAVHKRKQQNTDLDNKSQPAQKKAKIITFLR